MPKLDKRFEILDYLWEFCKKGSNLPLWISVSKAATYLDFFLCLLCGVRVRTIPISVETKKGQGLMLLPL